jgi:hypothetical protein
MTGHPSNTPSPKSDDTNWISNRFGPVIKQAVAQPPPYQNPKTPKPQNPEYMKYIKNRLNEMECFYKLKKYENDFLHMNCDIRYYYLKYKGS